MFHNETHLEIMHSTQFATLKSHSLLVWGGGGGGGRGGGGGGGGGGGVNLSCNLHRQI